MHKSAYQGHVDVCRLLLENRADVDMAMDNGAGPLFISAIISFQLYERAHLSLLDHLFLLISRYLQ